MRVKGHIPICLRADEDYWLCPQGLAHIDKFIRTAASFLAEITVATNCSDVADIATSIGVIVMEVAEIEESLLPPGAKASLALEQDECVCALFNFRFLGNVTHLYADLKKQWKDGMSQVLATAVKCRQHPCIVRSNYNIEAGGIVAVVDKNYSSDDRLVSYPIPFNCQCSDVKSQYFHFTYEGVASKFSPCSPEEEVLLWQPVGPAKARLSFSRKLIANSDELLAFGPDISLRGVGATIRGDNRSALFVPEETFCTTGPIELHFTGASEPLVLRSKVVEFCVPKAATACLWYVFNDSAGAISDHSLFHPELEDTLPLLVKNDRVFDRDSGVLIQGRQQFPPLWEVDGVACIGYGEALLNFEAGVLKELQLHEQDSDHVILVDSSLDFADTLLQGGIMESKE